MRIRPVPFAVCALLVMCSFGAAAQTPSMTPTPSATPIALVSARDENDLGRRIIDQESSVRNQLETLGYPDEDFQLARSGAPRCDRQSFREAAR